MSQFRNKQTSKDNRPVMSSVDGFMKPRSARGQPYYGSPANNNPGQVQTQRQIGNFSGKEGMSSSRKSQNIPSGSYRPTFEEPILIAKKDTNRRRLFGLLPPKKSANRWNNLSRKRKIITVTISLLTVILIVLGFLIFKGYLNVNRVLKGGGGAAALDSNVDPSRLRGEGDGRVNVLLLGRGGEGHEAPDLTDSIIIASIDPIANEASLLSIPRDLYVPVAGSGSMKINAVYETGKSAALAKVSRQRPSDESKRQAENAGFTMLEQTIEKNLGLPVHYRAIIDFGGFRQAVDTVGGVSVNAPDKVIETMRIDGKQYKLNVQPGVQQMDGFKALAYSRSRYTSPRGDFDRAERQRLIILALKEKVLSAGTFSNPAKISGLLDTLGTRVITNFSVQDTTRLYELAKQIDQSKITSIGLADPPNNYVITDNVGGQSVVLPRAGIGNFSEIKGYLRNVLKDSFIRNENASIAILNGTETSGLATEKANELKSYGYNITTVDNAPTRTYNKTVIVNLRGGDKKYTKSYLEKRFAVPSVSVLPDTTIVPGTADFVIIVGRDQSKTQY